MTNDMVEGNLKIKSLVDSKYFKSWKDFLLNLPNMLSVEVPADVTNVVVGQDQPGDDKRDNVWIRLNSAGTFVGMYVYTGGAWRQVAPAPNQVIKMHGDSRDIPAGYTLADENNPKIPTSAGLILKATWPQDPSLTYYTVFDVTMD